MKKDLYKSGADIKALEVVIAARKESVNNDKNKAIFSMSIPWGENTTFTALRRRIRLGSMRLDSFEVGCQVELTRCQNCTSSRYS